MPFQTTKQRGLIAMTKSTNTSAQQFVHSVISVGGSGKEAIFALMKDGEFSHTHVSAIDADASGLEHLDSDDKLVVNEVPAANMLDEMEANPELYSNDEYLLNVSRMRKVLGTSEYLSHGLQTSRVLGLLVMLFYLCRRSEELLAFLSRPFRTLLGESVGGCAQGGMQQGIKHKLRVMHTFVFGASGGTGSGMTLLLADLLRTLLRQRWGVTHSEAEADIFLPGAKLYQANSPMTLLADTHATIKELVQRQQKSMRSIQLGPMLVDRSRCPFSTITVFDDTNLNGLVLKDSEQVAQIWALTYRLRNSGIEGEWYRARLSDYKHHRPFNNFSAAGAVELCIFGDELATDFALRTAQQIATTMVSVGGYEAVQRRVQQAHREFLNRQPEFAEVPAIQTDLSGKRIQANISRFAPMARRLLPQVIERYARQNVPQWQEAYVQQKQAIYMQMATVITDEVSQLLNGADGLVVSQKFLSELITSLEQQREQQMKRVERADSQSKQSTAPLEQQGIGKWWRKISLNPRRDYVANHQTALDTELEAMRQRARLQLVVDLIKMVRSRTEVLSHWQQTVQQLATTLEQERLSWHAHVMAERPICQESVLCPTEIEALYSQGSLRSAQQSADAMHFVWSEATQDFVLTLNVAMESAEFGTQAVLSDEGIQALVKFCEQSWQHLQELSVESVLRQQGRNPESVLNELMEKAAPLVSLNEAKQIPPEQRLMVLSSESCDFFTPLVKSSGLSMVRTDKKQRLGFLYTIHGFNPFNLAKAQSWKQAYEQRQREGYPLHLFPDQEEPLSQADHNSIQ